MARGRKRKTGVAREPNGQVSRRKADQAAFKKAEEWDTLSTAMEARQRVFGISRADALDPCATSAVGRLCISKEISHNQYEAAQLYLRDRDMARRAIGAPMDYKEPRQEGMAGWSDGGTTHEDFVERANARWAHVVSLVAESDRESGSRLPSKAMEIIVCRDIEAPYLVGYLRIALNGLVRFYLQGKRQAA